jgi:hypothetical protein
MSENKTSATPPVIEVMERVERLFAIERPRYRRLWAYCRNPMRTNVVVDESGSEKPYVQAQEWGLPSRITGIKTGSDVFEGELLDGITRKEVVIENDIGWRIDTMVDYLFGKPLVIESTVADPNRKKIISDLLGLILGHNGGILFLQQLALLGCVYGFVDVLVKLKDGGEEAAGDPGGNGGAGGVVETEASTGDGEAPEDAVSAPVADERPQIDGTSPTRDATDVSPEALERLARFVRLEIVEPARALPFLCNEDWRVIDTYGQAWEVHRNPSADGSHAVMKRGIFARARKGMARWLAKGTEFTPWAGDNKTVMVELISADRWCRYEDGKLVSEGENSLGRLPLVHVQNAAVPFEYSGAGDVEPLIPLQDELNIRLSDRANRITLQSFKMYLGKGIDGFATMPIAPGRMWATENEAANVVEFGGDANCPSEDSHISDLREALDKTSGVTPIAAGAIKGRIGNLTSAAALRITLQALLSKTEKKRTCYGAAIEQMCELALAWLDRAGLFQTAPQERRVELHWPSPLPQNEIEKLDEAEAKLRVGISKDVVLRELGY